MPTIAKKIAMPRTKKRFIPNSSTKQVPYRYGNPQTVENIEPHHDGYSEVNG